LSEEDIMGKYFIQAHIPAWDTAWTTFTERPFDTLAEAKEFLFSRPFPKDYRIVEAYTVTRYKAVKL